MALGRPKRDIELFTLEEFEADLRMASIVELCVVADPKQIPLHLYLFSISFKSRLVEVCL